MDQQQAQHPKKLNDLKSLLNSSSAKDVPVKATEGVEGIYWEGMEAGLMGIPLFPGLIHASCSRVTGSRSDLTERVRELFLINTNRVG